MDENCPHCTGPPSPGSDPIPLLLTSDGQDWKPVQTCSLEDPLPPLELTSVGY